jgi:hypothetical protein
MANEVPTSVEQVLLEVGTAPRIVYGYPVPASHGIALRIQFGSYCISLLSGL